jgi:single-strand DNA-binding protein
MRGINKVILVGHLGKDPEVQHIEGGIAMAKFPMATTETYKDKSGNRVDQTEWHNITAWRGLADLCAKYLHKGNLVYVEGKIKTRSWTDKDNVKKYSTEIVADNINILERKPDGGEPMQHVASSIDSNDSTPADDLPF